MRTIRWGIIGCGDVTEVKSGPGFQKAPHSALVAVMRRNGRLAEDYARRHGVPRWYDDAAALIADPEVDAVYIATPPNAHKEYTLACARAGKPVYVEKPMARDFAECQAMIAACRTAGVPLYVAYYRRALPRFLKIRELVQSGIIGEVRLVTMTHYGALRGNPDSWKRPWRVRPEFSGGGLFVDQDSHSLDFMDFLFGPVTSVQGMAANLGGVYAAEDVVAGVLRFESGVYATGTWCHAAGERYERNQIVGSEGTLTFSTLGTEPVVLSGPAGNRKFRVRTPRHVQQPLIQTVVEALNGVGECPSTGETGARTTWVVDQLLQSRREQLRAREAHA